MEVRKTHRNAVAIDIQHPAETTAMVDLNTGSDSGTHNWLLTDLRTVVRQENVISEIWHVRAQDESGRQWSSHDTDGPAS